MNGQRILLPLVALCTGGWFILSGLALTDEPAGNAQHAGQNAAMQHCAKVCADCMRICESCARHCAMQVASGHKDYITTLATCADCGDICATTAKLVAREGPMAVTLCDACARVCGSCAAACEKLQEDKLMQDCARICRECEKVCRQMTEQAGHAAEKG
jgi:hypothetical protein